MKCRVPSKRAFCCFGFLLIAVGGVVVGVSLPKVLKAQRSTQAQCHIAGFQEDLERTVVQEGRACERGTCSFYVSAISDTGLAFYVMNWMPKYRSSYKSPTGLIPEHEAFDCCPHEAVSCCAYEDERTSLFCDNFGHIRPECPKGGWPCYFEDLEENLKDRAIQGYHLQVGDSREGFQPLAAGVTLLALGAFTLTCMRPKCYFVLLKQLLSMCSISGWYFSIAKWLPRSLRTEAMQRFVEEGAATFIQRQWRQHHARCAFREAVILAVDSKKNFVFKPCTYEQVYGPKMRRKLPAQNLLYDTGDPSTFRRVVHARTLASTTPGQQRIEVLITKNASWLADLLFVGSDHLGRELPPRIAGDPPKAFADMYGIKSGFHLMKAGKLEWPTQSSSVLVAAVRSARRPVLLTFEGPLPEEGPIRRSQLPPSMVVPPPFWLDGSRQPSKSSGPPPSKSLASLAGAGRSDEGASEGEELDHFDASGCGDLEHGLLPGQLPTSVPTEPVPRSRVELPGRLARTSVEDGGGSAASSPGGRRAMSVGGTPTSSGRRRDGWTAGRYSPLKGRQDNRVSSVSLPASPTVSMGGGRRRRRQPSRPPDGEDDLRRAAAAARQPSAGREGDVEVDD